jgi:hypothetical protein
MRKRRFRLPSPALVISMITLALVLGGTAFAASTAKHSDKKADIKLIKKLAPSLSVKHAKTATHATSATSATNATTATSATNASQLGGVAASGYQRATLPSGQTEVGEYAAWGTGGGYLGTQVNYSTPLAATLDSTHYQFIAQGGATTSQCTGLGHAAAGYLCVYEENRGASSLGGIYNSTLSPDAFTLLPTGFSIYFNTSGTSGSWSYGGWAVTAPTSAMTHAQKQGHKQSGSPPAAGG